MDRNSSQTFVIIMAGGVGSRFWPYSRNKRPKQFLDIFGTGQSLLQMTYNRFLQTAGKDNILIVTNQQYAKLVKEQLPDLQQDQILLEPARRNTAPCVAYACYKIHKKNPDATVVITPADHAIFNEDKFIATVEDGIAAAQKEGNLVTIGIKPTKPETGYGYIQYSEEKFGAARKVKTFTEKPELEWAKKFLESGDFVWNAGIFIWKTSTIIKEYENSLPEMAEAFDDGMEHYYTDTEQQYIDKAYTQCRNISIDYGIMEKAQDVYVVLGDFAWSDLGSWGSLYDNQKKEDKENIVMGAELLSYDSHSNIIKTDKDKLVILQDLEGYLVADFEDVLMIVKKDQEAKFREFVNDVKNKKGEELL
ncbi:MAG: mannose-1-phosphate guanylyltransferase [Imperialibacter sp.]